MSPRDLEQLRRWLVSNASLFEVEDADRIGLVGNERFTERARRAFIFLWTWSAMRFTGAAGSQQGVLYRRRGMRALNRRIERVQRIIHRIKYS